MEEAWWEEKEEEKGRRNSCTVLAPEIPTERYNNFEITTSVINYNCFDLSFFLD